MTVLPPAWFGSGVRVFWEKRNGASGQEWFGAWFPTGTVSSGESSISADSWYTALRTTSNVSWKSVRQPLDSSPANRWYHVAQVYSTTDSTLRLYVDGAQVASSSTVIQGSRAGNTSGTLDLGGVGGDPSQSWKGDIALFSFSNSALSAGTIAAHYAARSSLSAYLTAVGSPSALWPLQETSGLPVDTVAGHNATFLSGNPATYAVGGPVPGSTGIRLDGASFFSVPDDNLWSSTSFTMEGWVRAVTPDEGGLQWSGLRFGRGFG